MRTPARADCPSCGLERWYRDAHSAKVSGAKDCKSCAMRKRWENPSEAQVAAAKKWLAMGPEANRGRTLTDEHRAKLCAARVGRRPALGMKHTPESRAKIGAAGRGRKLTAEQVERLRAALHSHYGTEPDRTKPTRRELGRWAYLVVKRDGGKCVNCGYVKQGRKSVHAHHILSKARWPEYALDLDNGATLCVPCHEEVHRLFPSL